MRIYMVAAALAVAASAYAEESAIERAARKTGQFLERGADKVAPALDKAGKAIERGAKAAGRGVERAGRAVQKGGAKVHKKVDEAVRPAK
jgi:hypothetical protein